MINAAVVGLGWWGQKIVGDLSDSNDIRVVLGVDPEVRSVGGQELATARTIDEALASPDVDAVILCTPHRLHARQIIAAADAGKHVFCEKPLCTTSSEAHVALTAVENAGVQLGIGHERRFEPPIVALREAFANGDLGRPLVFEGNFSQDKFLALTADNWRLSAVDAPVGPLSATGIHLVDLAIAVLGTPVDVLARLSTQATAFANGDTLTVLITFEQGRTAVITAVLTTPFIGRVAVMGSSGWMDVRDRAHPENPQGWDVTVARRGQAPQTAFYPPARAVRANIEAFARAAQGLEAYPVTPAEMKANVAAFEAITRSAASGRVETVV